MSNKQGGNTEIYGAPASDKNSKEGANFLSGRKTSGKPGEDIAQYMVRDIGIETIGKSFFALEGKALIQRSKAKTDYYFTAIRLSIIDMFEIKSDR